MQRANAKGNSQRNGRPINRTREQRVQKILFLNPISCLLSHFKSQRYLLSEYLAVPTEVGIDVCSRISFPHFGSTAVAFSLQLSVKAGRVTAKWAARHGLRMALNNLETISREHQLTNAIGLKQTSSSHCLHSREHKWLVLWCLDWQLILSI